MRRTVFPHHVKESAIRSTTWSSRGQVQGSVVRALSSCAQSIIDWLSYIPVQDHAVVFFFSFVGHRLFLFERPPATYHRPTCSLSACTLDHSATHARIRHCAVRNMSLNQKLQARQAIVPIPVAPTREFCICVFSFSKNEACRQLGRKAIWSGGRMIITHSRS